MLLDVSSPIGAFSKILLGSSRWGNSMEYCYAWGRLNTKFGLSAFQLTPWEQSTGDNGCSLWQTPVADDAMDREKGKINSRGEPKLSAQAKLWSTPTVPNGGRRNPEGTSITGKKPDGGKAQMGIREFAIRNSQESSGSLNPRFVEQLMGYEIDHTDLKPSATVWSRSKPTRSSKRSRKY
jgi:hypothetical protein